MSSFDIFGFARKPTRTGHVFFRSREPDALRGCGFGKNPIYAEALTNTMRSGSSKTALSNRNEASKKHQRGRGEDGKVRGE